MGGLLRILGLRGLRQAPPGHGASVYSKEIQGLKAGLGRLVIHRQSDAFVRSLGHVPHMLFMIPV